MTSKFLNVFTSEVASGMDIDELLNVIEKGLKDVRAELLHKKHPEQLTQKTMSPEARLNELEWTMSSVQSKLAMVTSTMRVLEMNVAKLKHAAAGTAAVQPAGRRRSAATKPSPASKSRGRRV